MRNFIRSAVIGAIVATVPLSASAAAVRPSAAVPTAGTAAVATQATVYDTRYDRGSQFAAAWPIVGFGVIMGALVLLEALGEDENELPITRG